MVIGVLGRKESVGFLEIHNELGIRNEELWYVSNI